VSETTLLQCVVVSGGGNEIPSGIWQKTETAKTITFVLTDKPFHMPDVKSFRVKNELSEDRYASNGHVLIDWEDGTFTASESLAGLECALIPNIITTAK